MNPPTSHIRAAIEDAKSAAAWALLRLGPEKDEAVERAAAKTAEFTETAERFNALAAWLEANP